MNKFWIQSREFGVTWTDKWSRAMQKCNKSSPLSSPSHLDTNVMHSSWLVFQQEARDGALLSERMEQLQLGVAELHEHSVDTMIGQGHLLTHRGPQHVPIQRRGLLHVGDSDGDVVKPAQLPQRRGNTLMEGHCCWMCPPERDARASGNTCR